MPKLRPFRDYDEKDVINLYSVSGLSSLPLNNGTLVTPAGDGFRLDAEATEMLGNYGDFSVTNFVAQRYGVVAKVRVAQPTDKPLGLTLFDVREYDENNIPLKYSPRKAAEMEAVLSGQAVPLVTRGTFAISGIVVSGGVAVVAGADAYAGFNGSIATSGINKIGKFLGQTGAEQTTAVVWLNCA
jgi:hypothetical protein